MNRFLRRWGWGILLLLALGGYWLLPISGEVLILPGDEAGLWPQMRLVPASPRPGQRVSLWIADTVPWPYVLLTVNGRPLHPEEWDESGDIATWKWSFPFPDAPSTTLIFYHNCHTGCVERGRMTLGPSPEPTSASRMPTKLGVVFANPQRDWHGRSGWVVDLTYARQAEEEYWGIDDLAERVQQATAKGLRVLVRVDYDYNQSIPPVEDYIARAEYLSYLRRLARDERLRGVYGYIIGSGYNARSSNALSPQRPVTPAWYAQVFNGYGEPVTYTDNAVQIIRSENPYVRVLVGPIWPWIADQDGEKVWLPSAPWLNYMNTLVAFLDESARLKAAAGIPLAAPDGFALQVPGRPDAPDMIGRLPAEEPRLDMRRSEWGGAQAGFRIYEDWLTIINAYPTTKGLPAYITSSNTFAPDQEVPPAQNYPRGWLTTAMAVVNEEPQIHALCWFLDYYPHDHQWDWFSLTLRGGRLVDAAEEFDALLRAP